MGEVRQQQDFVWTSVSEADLLQQQPLAWLVCCWLHSQPETGAAGKTRQAIRIRTKKRYMDAFFSLTEKPSRNAFIVFL
tara:strand:- start:1880 stop:2116 length:237 start_codon:yes stop_codon:yes gene_type:complete